MKRIIYPVGQGAFYVEIFDDYRAFIYDCGSNNSNISDLKMCIDDFCKIKCLTIEGLFISHFHADHVNGIQYLIEQLKLYGVVIKKIFLPQITNSQIKLNLAQLAFFAPDGNYESLKSLIDLIQEPSKYFTGYFPNVDIIEVTQELNLNNVIKDIDSVSGTIESNTKIIFNKWYYIPFNYDAVSSIDLDAILASNGLSDDIFDDISGEDKWRDIQDLVKSSISYLHHNFSSMVLFSGSLNGTKIDIYRNGMVTGNFNHYDGALYVGDYPTHDLNYLNKLCEFVFMHNSFDTTVGLVQISHHGSNIDFFTNVDTRTRFYDVFSKSEPMFFACFGSPNKYGHPSKNLSIHLKHLFNVTNNSHSLALECQFPT